MKEVDETLATVIGSTEIYLVGDKKSIRDGETNLGDLLADMVCTSVGAQIGMVNAGSIRSSVEPGSITEHMVYNVYPFLNYVCTLDVYGSDIWKEMEFSLSVGKGQGGFIQFSGMTVTYDPNAESGNKVRSIVINGEEIDMDATYSVAMTDYIWKGGDGNDLFVNYEGKPHDTIDVVFIDSFKQIGVIDDSTIIGNRLVTNA